ncbi:MAG: dCTP deaminase [Candidatus Woesearchaeota archaeon]
MSILSKEAILDEIKKNNIKISPFNKKNLGPASYDLTLDDKFRFFDKNIKIIDINENSDYQKLTSFKRLKSIILLPGDLILGITKERITLNPSICGRLSGRSRFARLGLGVHITADFVQPGIKNKQILEIKNLSNVPLKLNANSKIMQIMFERIEGLPSKYNGRFVKQTKI